MPPVFSLSGSLLLLGLLGREAAYGAKFNHDHYFPGYNLHGAHHTKSDTDKTIETPQKASDVVDLVKRAKWRHQTVSAGGGQNTAWWDAGDVAISMEKMTEVLHVDSEKLTMTVQTGLTAGQIQEAANGHHMMAAIGQSAKVGVGFLLQGGFGHQTRMMGLGSDRVVGAEVVTANGDHVCVGNHKGSNPKRKGPCKALPKEDDANLLYAVRG